MKNKPIRLAIVMAGAVLLSGLCLPTPTRADVSVPAGYDFFTTDPSGTTFGGVNFQGVPLGTYGPLNVGSTDTIIQRLSDVTVPAGGSVSVSIQVDAMQLQSVLPMFASPSGSQYGYLTLDNSEASIGTMTINSSGTFSSSLDVFFDVYAGSLSGTLEAAGSLSLSGSGNWSPAPNGWYVATSYFDVTPTITFAPDTWTTADQNGVLTLQSTVPEPSTCLAGAMLLIPLGAGAVRRLLQKNRAA
jgi:hypothetical protein